MNLGDRGTELAINGMRGAFENIGKAGVERQRAESEAMLRAAQAYAANQQGNKYGAEAEGLAYTNQQRMGIPDMIAANPDLAEHVRQMYRAFNLTGDTNIERFAKASGAFQKQGDIAAIQGGLDPTATGQAYAAVSGNAPFKAVGDTGRNINTLTGYGNIIDQSLAGGYDGKIGSEIGRNNAAAGASSASAANSYASAGLTNAKLGHFREKGSLPGTGAEGSEGSLSSTIMNTLRTPALDAKGRVVRNPITGETETVIDQGAQKDFYKWANANGRRPTAAAFAQWEAQDRPAVGNDNTAANVDLVARLAAPESRAKATPAAKPAAKVADAPRAAHQRKAGQIYNTPKGPLKWTGTGWIQP